VSWGERLLGERKASQDLPCRNRTIKPVHRRRPLAAGRADWFPRTCLQASTSKNQLGARVGCALPLYPHTIERYQRAHPK
jgi:hypothetical protein